MFKITLNGGRTMEVPEKTFWHTTSHIMAQAIKRLYPEIKLAIRPAIDNGFYYDFDTDKPFTPEMLEEIEEEMKKIVKEDLTLERFVLTRKEALEFIKFTKLKIIQFLCLECSNNNISKDKLMPWFSNFNKTDKRFLRIFRNYWLY